ncbi:hypothetical protein [Engelhardtia mirabilis]
MKDPRVTAALIGGASSVIVAVIGVIASIILGKSAAGDAAGKAAGPAVLKSIESRGGQIEELAVQLDSIESRLQPLKALEGFRILYGRVDSNGNSAGIGFSSRRGGDFYEINFDKPFMGEPTVVATFDRHQPSDSTAGDNTLRINAERDGCRVYTRDLFVGADGDVDTKDTHASFAFLAIGIDSE